VGVGSRNDINISKSDLDQILDRGMEWLVEQEMAWPEDAELCEERGSMRIACSSKVSNRAKSRGLTQIGTLGSGNHYCEVQLVDEVFDETAAAAMGLRLGQVVVMLHSGSRGLGHQVCTDYLQRIQRDATEQAGLPYMQNDRQLSGALINSTVGRDYLAAMAAAANFAWVNRGCMTAQVRKPSATCLAARRNGSTCTSCTRSRTTSPRSSATRCPTAPSATCSCTARALRAPSRPTTPRYRSSTNPSASRC